MGIGRPQAVEPIGGAPRPDRGPGRRGNAPGQWRRGTLMGRERLLRARFEPGRRQCSRRSVSPLEPLTNAGTPDAADPQVGSFSPLAILVMGLVSEPKSAFLAYWFLVWWLAGLGMLALGRHLRVPAVAAAIGSIAFVTSGAFIGHAQHTSIVYTLASLPWALWRLDVALLRRRAAPAAQAGAIWGLGALGGYPGVIILNGTFLGLWALGRWFCGSMGRISDRPRPRRPRALVETAVALALLVAVGIVVLAPSYVAFFAEGREYSDRSGALDRETAVENNALHPWTLFSATTPYFPVIRVLNRPTPWFYTAVSSGNLYLVGMGFVLAGAALFSGRDIRWRWVLAGIALCYLAAGFGRVLPVRGWLYDLLPPFRYFRHASIFRLHFLFAASVLAMLGTADFVAPRAGEGSGRRRRSGLRSRPSAPAGGWRSSGS